MFDHGDEVVGRQPRRPDDVGLFLAMFPTETAGLGRIAGNNLLTGAGQGKSSAKRKVSCLQCGFMADLARRVNDGGEAEGRDFAIAKSAPSGTTPRGDTISDVVGESSGKKGCPNCGSKNFSEVLPHEKDEDSLVRRILEVTYGY